ncbi:hypothetical protein HNQ94_002466 [Salirhabdus euzebyi]|uniref:Cof-type HAD-IIB family hydrolase n=1 Tax=Salirhabdus euzebyi TaxID=394506 RepID=A0A841Q6K8_9BACI|nr:HAD family hydrolase [Salirhabdus euzebyi]MBB6454015.1 hypothetical protein [Salirhabdus euzebyi]
MDIFISDLDGTLLQKDATLSTTTKDILINLLNEGLLFTVASARSVKTIQPILQGIPISIPIIEFNGAYLSDLHTGEHLFVHNIETSLLDSIYSIGLRHKTKPFISTYNGKKDCLYVPEIDNAGQDFYFQERVRMKDDRLIKGEKLPSSFQDKVVCFTFINRLEMLIGLKDELVDQLGSRVEVHLFEEIYNPGWYWLTIHDKRATKDQAIQTLKEYINLPTAKVTVFGDQVNDIKMFKSADYAVAVENACDECKDIADKTIGLHTEDSVARYIQAAWVLKKKGVKQKEKL